MTLFWTLAALSAAVVLVWLLRPLVFPYHKRPCLPTREQIDRLQAERMLLEKGEWDQNRWQQARNALAQEWLHSVDEWLNQSQKVQPGWFMAIVLAFMLPLLGWQLYQQIGSPGILNAGTASTQTTSADSPEALQKNLEQRIQANPEDLEAWVLLARLHHEFKRFADAEQAYLKALELAPEEPLILVELAENRLFASGQRSFDDQSRQWLRDALTLDPQNQKALWLLGLDASQHEQWELARQYWESLMPQLPAGSAVHDAVLKQLKDVYAQLDEPLPESLQQPAETTQLKLRISLDASLKNQLPPDPVLFVFARAANGPPMPLAAKKLPVDAFPLEVTLSDADSLMPQRKLSSAREWIVSARIASEGQAKGENGDLEAEAVKTSAEHADQVLELHINRIRQPVQKPQTQ